MGEPSGARRPPDVLRRRNSWRPSSAGFQPMPTSWVQPNRSPLGALRSNSSVSGRLPAGPAAVDCTSNRAGSDSTREANGEAVAVMGNPGQGQGTQVLPVHAQSIVERDPTGLPEAAVAAGFLHRDPPAILTRASVSPVGSQRVL